MTEKTIAFCTTCKGRVQHIEKTLPKNLADNQNYKNAKFIILDYGSPDNLLSYLKSNHQKDIDSGRLTVYSYKTNTPFRMSHAKNMAHRLGILEGGDVLVNLDADNYTHENYASYINDMFQTEGTFLWAGNVKGKGRKYRGCSGRIIVPKIAFLKAGGYDEKYKTWAPDDKDFTARLQNLGYASVEADRQFLEAVFHSDGLRFKEYPQALENIEDYEAVEFDRIEKSTETVVNFGNVGVGTVYKNFDFNTPIELKPIATRIFGIGLHKTATTSLSKAFSILGFDTIHWDAPWKAKKLYEEVLIGKSKTIDEHYTFCDLPIPLIYKELDILYPGSKFILTMRDENAWLTSIANHWTYGKNKWRKTWDSDCFTHKIHKVLYGQRNFDSDIFLKRYRDHNSEVQEYFKGRGDLLVMGTHSWENLCPFLNLPIPEVSYPRALVTCE